MSGFMSFVKAAAVLSLGLFTVTCSLKAESGTSPNEHLAPLAPFVGKTWQTGTPGEGFSDVSRWDWAMHGQAIRILHSVNGGTYGGETLVHYDPSIDHIVYRYVTTAGFFTNGVVTLTEDGFTVEEDVVGLPDIIGTKAGYSLKDGSMQACSQFIRKDGPGPTSCNSYVETPGAVYDVDQ